MSLERCRKWLTTVCDKGELTNDVTDSWKSESNGGTGAAKKFLEYCDRETKDYL